MSCGGDSDIVLNSPSGASYEIHIASDSAPEVVKAVKDLAKYIELITDRQIRITSDSSELSQIRVGQYYKEDLNLLDRSSVAYWAEGENIIISGGGDDAIVNSVYTFLENEMAIDFLAPDAEVIPRCPEGISISSNLQYSYTPSIVTRTVHSDLFYLNPTYAAKRKVTSDAFPGYAPEARVHTFHRFLPASEYYNSHPEYFALRNGKRITTQLCLTNEQVLEIVKSKVLELKESNPKAKVISVSQDDNTQYCQCDACEAIHDREGSPAGSMIDFVNKVATAFPDIQISTLAYQYTRKAPKHVRPAPNVLVTLCSIECDRSAPIADKCEDFRNDLEEWSRITSNIRIWDYTTQFTNFLAPFPNLRTLKPNIDLFVENNAQWVFEQHSRNPSELFELRSYVMSQLLWNPDQNVEDVIDLFLNGYYKEAAPKVATYITAIHDAIEQDSNFFLFLYGDPAQGFDTWLSKEQLEYYDLLFDEAEELVSTQPDIVDRVRGARLSVDFSILEYGRKDLSGVDQIGRLTLLERLKRFNNTTSEQGITAMNEIRLTVADYVASYLAAIDRSKLINKAFGKEVTLLTKPKKYADEDPMVLTDGALGGLNFYSNWLGFEGVHAEAVVDLGSMQAVSSIGTAFLQVTNHLVFLPKQVSFYGSKDGKNYILIGTHKNSSPLTSDSKINDIQVFKLEFRRSEFRFIKVVGESLLKAPDWHNGSGLPAWVFLDEIIVS